MPAVAVVPVKSLALGKQRLSASLDISQRGALAQAMTEHVSRVAEQAGLIPVVVTADPEVANWAAGAAIPFLPDPGDGLSAAAAAGAGWAEASGSTWVVLHSDLPLLTAAELAGFLERAEQSDVIAPSADGGTSAISSHRTIEFAYGPGSFSRHLGRLANPAVLASPGFLHDVDSPADLESICSHPRGRWVRDVIG